MNYKIPQFYPFPQNDPPSLTQNVYSNTSSTPWAGFGNTNKDINPLIFTNPGKITFDYEANNGAVNIKFKLERQAHIQGDPDSTKPEYITPEFTCSGSGTGEITIPNQGINTFESFVLYLVTQEVAVKLTNIRVYDDESVAAVEPTISQVKRYSKQPISTDISRMWKPSKDFNSPFNKVMLKKGSSDGSDYIKFKRLQQRVLDKKN